MIFNINQKPQSPPESDVPVAVLPDDIIRIARTYIGTPWHHAGRKKGVAVDCAGLLVCVSHELGVPVEDFVNYDRLDEYKSLVGVIGKYCEVVAEGQQLLAGGAVLQAGDILVFRARQMYNHCGFYTGEGTMVHAYNTPGVERVVETAFDEHWWTRLSVVYRYRGATWQP